MPASTSSNTMQRVASALHATCTARDRRASSPPEATLASALGQLRRCNPVLARELLDRRQASFDLVLARGVDVEGLAVAFQLTRRLAHLNRGFLQHRQHDRELAIQRRESAQGLQRAAHAGMRTRGFVLVELREGRLRALREPPAAGEPLALLAECVDLAGLQLQGLQLLRLIAQQLEAGGRGPPPALPIPGAG